MTTRISRFIRTLTLAGMLLFLAGSVRAEPFYIILWYGHVSRCGIGGSEYPRAFDNGISMAYVADDTYHEDKDMVAFNATMNQFYSPFEVPRGLATTLPELARVVGEHVQLLKVDCPGGYYKLQWVSPVGEYQNKLPCPPFGRDWNVWYTPKQILEVPIYLPRYERPIIIERPLIERPLDCDPPYVDPYANHGYGYGRGAYGGDGTVGNSYTSESAQRFWHQSDRPVNQSRGNFYRSDPPRSTVIIGRRDSTHVEIVTPAPPPPPGYWGRRRHH